MHRYVLPNRTIFSPYVFTSIFSFLIVPVSIRFDKRNKFVNFCAIFSIVPDNKNSNGGKSVET